MSYDNIFQKIDLRNHNNARFKPKAINALNTFNPGLNILIYPC